MFENLADKLKSEFKKHLKLSDDEEVKKELRFIRELIKGVKDKVRTVYNNQFHSFLIIDNQAIFLLKAITLNYF